MAVNVADRVREISSTTGTGAITLGGAALGFQTFTSAFVSATTQVYYCITSLSGDWEVGIGTFTRASNVLSRDTVITSSNSNALVTLPAGNKEVFVTMPASKTVASDGTGATGTWTLSISGDAGTLGGQNGAYYLNLTNATGTINTARLSTTLGSYSIDPIGPRTNVPHTTLSGATIGEIALPGTPYLENKMAFVTPTSLEYSTDGGTNWLTHPTSVTSATIKNMFLGYNSGAIGVSILGPNNGNWTHVRMTFTATNYWYLDYLYFYNSTNGHTANVRLERSYGADNTTWSDVASTANFSTWPGHTLIPHSVIPFNSTPTPGTHSKFVRITWGVASWNATYPSNNIDIYNIIWYGAYPAASSPTLYTWDNAKNATFPAGVTATSFTGLASSATKSTNLAAGTLGSVAYQTAADTTAYVPVNSSTTKMFLTQTGNGTVSAAPGWLALTSGDVTGALTYIPAQRSVNNFADSVTPNRSLAAADSRTLANPTTGIGYAGGGRFRFGYTNDVDASQAYSDIIDLSTYTDASGGGFNSLYFRKTVQTIQHKWAAAAGTTWTTKTVAYLDSTFTGLWNGTIIDPTYGGTGVNNTGKTITLAGNLSTAGAFALTLTATAATNVTLPATGTLATLAGSETFTNKTLTSPTINGGLLDSLTVGGKLLMKLPNSSTQTGPWNPVFSNVYGGYCLFNDPEFSVGLNGITVYNNSGGSGAVLTRAADASAPNNSGFSLSIVVDGVNPTSPGLGGFVQLYNSRRNATIVQVFRAKAPVGYTLNIAENAIGTNSTSYWMSNNVGTGLWEDYVRVTHCGDSGSFSNGGHVYLSGPAGAVTWYVASCTAYDLTRSPSQISSVQGKVLTFNNTMTLAAPDSSALTFGGAFTTSGAFPLTLTVTASTNVTLPTTGTLATLAGTETLSNKTLTTPVISSIKNNGISSTSTWDPANKNAAIVLSNGNLTAVGSGNNGSVKGTVGVSSGKYYWEITGNGTTYSAYAMVGVGNATAALTDYPGGNANSWGYYFQTGNKYFNLVSTAYGSTSGSTATVGVKLDMDAGTIGFIVGGVDQGIAFSGLTGTLYPMFGGGTAAGTSSVTANFGATTFVYSVPAGYTPGVGGATLINLTLPAYAGTLATLAGTETLSNKTLVSPIISGRMISTNSTLTAGTNAQGQGAITSDFTVVTSTPNNPSGVTLPTASAGRTVILVNKGTNPVAMFPATGGFVDGAAINTAITVPVNGWIELEASSATQWYSTANSSFGSGIISLGGNLTTSGAFPLTLTATASTNVTLPTTGTLATLAGAEALTSKTINGLTPTAAAVGWTLAGGTTSKTLTLSNTMTLAGTDGSTLNIGAGGTLGSAAFTASTAYATPGQTFFLGTTSIAINRASAAIALTGITSIDGSAATVTTAAQPNITSVGTLTGLTVTGATNPAFNNSTSLGGTAGNNVKILEAKGLTSNAFYRREWLYRNTTGADWTTAGWFDGISVDASFDVPGTNTKTWWLRLPNSNTQKFGGGASTYVTIDSTGISAVNLSGTNTGDNAANSSITFIGTTSVALNRASAALSLTGITSIDGYAAGIAGGTLGSIPYQTASNTTGLVAPNTTTTKKFLTQTGTGAVGAAPAWDTIQATDVTTALGFTPAGMNLAPIGGGTLAAGLHHLIAVNAVYTLADLTSSPALTVLSSLSSSASYTTSITTSDGWTISTGFSSAGYRMIAPLSSATPHGHWGALTMTPPVLSTITVPSTTSMSLNATVALSSTLHVVLISDTTTPNQYVLAYNPTDGSIGSLVAVNPGGGGAAGDLFAVSSTSFVLFSGAGNYPIVVGTVSGLTITLGTPVNLTNPPNDIVQLSSTLYVVHLNVSNDLKAISISGTTVTVGTGVSSGVISTSAGRLAPVSSTSFLLACPTFPTSPTTITVRAGSISGTTITLGTAVTTGNISRASTTSPNLGLFSFSNTGPYFIAAYDNSGTSINFYGVTVTGTTVTVGTLQQKTGNDYGNLASWKRTSDAVPNNVHSQPYAPIDSSRALLASPLGIQVLSISGTVLTFNTPVTVTGTPTTLTTDISTGTVFMAAGSSSLAVISVSGTTVSAGPVASISSTPVALYTSTLTDKAAFYGGAWYNWSGLPACTIPIASDKYIRAVANTGVITIYGNFS